MAIAGQVAMDEHGELVGPGDPVAQTERVFENLRLALAAAGATFADIVKFGVFVTDMSFLPVVREIRDRHVDPAQPPASTAVEVAALFRPGYLVEIDALAVVHDTCSTFQGSPPRRGLRADTFMHTRPNRYRTSLRRVLREGHPYR